MTIQQWLFSFKGRIGRRDFWVWMVTWVVAMLLLFFVAYNAWLSTQTAAFALVCLLWPTAAVVVKRLHDRGRSGAWAFLIILAWMLVAGNWDPATLALFIFERHQLIVIRGDHQSDDISVHHRTV